MSSRYLTNGKRLVEVIQDEVDRDLIMCKDAKSDTTVMVVRKDVPKLWRPVEPMTDAERLADDAKKTAAFEARVSGRAA